MVKDSASLCIEGLNDSLQSLLAGQKSHFGGPHLYHLITSYESHSLPTSRSTGFTDKHLRTMGIRRNKEDS